MHVVKAVRHYGDLTALKAVKEEEAAKEGEFILFPTDPKN